MDGLIGHSHGTSHVVTTDASGMAFSLTTTINTFFGSRVMVPETGVIMNNEMNGKYILLPQAILSITLTPAYRLLHSKYLQLLRLLPLPSQLCPSGCAFPLFHLSNYSLSPQRDPSHSLRGIRWIQDNNRNHSKCASHLLGQIAISGRAREATIT